MQVDRRVSVLSLEGLIGCGKSTQLGLLKAAYADDPRVLFVDEPVDEWNNLGILKAMYDNKMDSGMFQLTALMSRMAPIITAIQTEVMVVVSERSWLSDYAVFARANLSGITLETYRYVFSKLQCVVEKLGCTDITMLYMRCPIETAMLRTRARSRDAESNISFAYMKDLHERHNEMIDLAHSDRLMCNLYSPERAGCSFLPRMRTTGVTIDSDRDIQTIHLSIKGHVEVALLRQMRLVSYSYRV